MLREREPLLRGFAAPPEADLREPDAAFAPLDRLAPLLDDFARVEADLRAPPLPDREPLDLRAPLLRDDVEDDEEPELAPALAVPSIVHLPDMTRCAASATASAMSEPSLVALAMTLLAA